MYGKTIGVIALAALAVVGTTITVQHVFAGNQYMNMGTRASVTYSTPHV